LREIGGGDFGSAEYDVVGLCDATQASYDPSRPFGGATCSGMPQSERVAGAAKSCSKLKLPRKMRDTPILYRFPPEATVG